MECGLIEAFRAVAPGLEPSLLRLVTAGTLWVVLALLAVAADRVLVGFGREVLYQYHRERG